MSNGKDLCVVCCENEADKTMKALDQALLGTVYGILELPICSGCNEAQDPENNKAALRRELIKDGLITGAGWDEKYMVEKFEKPISTDEAKKYLN